MVFLKKNFEKDDFENKNKKQQQQQKQQTTKEYHNISRGGGGGGGGQRVNTIFPVYSSENQSGLRNYTGCAEWYAHAFFAYT